MRYALIVSALLAAPSLAVAQSTDCYTTGYGQQQHLWCNTTPAPTTSYGAAQANAYSALGTAIGSMIGAAIRKPQSGDADRVQVEIAAFASAHSDFQIYRERMAEMLDAGRAQNLQDAYTLARYGN